MRSSIGCTCAARRMKCCRLRKNISLPAIGKRSTQRLPDTPIRCWAPRLAPNTTGCSVASSTSRRHRSALGHDAEHSLLTALLSDIHGNLEALNACLAHACDHGAKRFAFLGDLVGYGADAREVVDTVARYAAEGAVVLKGNHDEAIEQPGGYFNEASRASLEWA